MADPRKHLVFAILKFFEGQRESGNLSEDAKESLEVAMQCLEAVYEVYPHEDAVVRQFPLPEGGLPAVFTAGMAQLVAEKKSISDSEKVDADKHKAEGNELMKQEKFSDALSCYNRAIDIDSSNAVYYCNRAAAHSKLQEHNKALEDCMAALSIDPNYSKAYGRKGLAHVALNQFEDACHAYRRALELDPANDSYKNCLEQAEQKAHESRSGDALQQGMNFGNMDFGSLLNNPALMNMATSMMSNPQMQNMMANMMSGMGGGAAAPGGGGVPGAPGGGGVPSVPGGAGGAGGADAGGAPMNLEAMMQAGQQLAEQMRTQNPELVDQLRQQMGRPSDEQDPPPGTS